VANRADVFWPDRFDVKTILALAREGIQPQSSNAADRASLGGLSQGGIFLLPGDPRTRKTFLMPLSRHRLILEEVRFSWSTSNNVYGLQF
jgi:hypothetical protein